MKTHKKVVISSLALLSVLTLAGSISGTISWYQYATVAKVAYTGTSAHCSKLLQLSVDNGQTWSTDIINSQLPDNISFAPVTTGEQAKDQPISLKSKTTNIYDSNGAVVDTRTDTSYFYSQPKRGQGLYENWMLAGPTTYLRFEILVKVLDVDGAQTENDLANDVYLTDLTIQDANNSGVDLSNAIRVHISSSYQDNGSDAAKNFLFAKNSTDIEVGGFLNLFGGDENDQAGYEWEKHTCVYGGGELKTDDQGNIVQPEQCINVPHQTSYKADDPTIVAKNADDNFENCTSIGKTSANNDQYLKLTVSIWLEGWSLLTNGVASTTNASVWDAQSYIGKKFNVGMTFEVAPHNSQE